jgi:hypothetical protein
LNGTYTLGGQLGYSTELENIYLNDGGSDLEENVSEFLLMFWGVW